MYGDAAYIMCCVFVLWNFIFFCLSVYLLVVSFICVHILKGIIGAHLIRHLEACTTKIVKICHTCVCPRSLHLHSVSGK